MTPAPANDQNGLANLRAAAEGLRLTSNDQGDDAISFSSNPPSRRSSQFRGEPMMQPLGQARTDKSRSMSFVEASDNTSSVGMLKTPSEVVTEGMLNEPEIFTLFSMKNRSAIVTGAARGLGIVLASALVEAGADVYCCDILDEPSADEWKVLQHKASQQKVKVQYHQMDITNAEQTAQVFDNIEQEIQNNATDGKIKLLRAVIANAATQQEIPAIDYPQADFAKMMRINVEGTFLTCQAAARSMKKHGRGGAIMITASMSARIANRGLICAAYNTSKAAVAQLTRNLAMEWAEYNIRVNSLSPGYIHTAMLNSLIRVNPSIVGIMQNTNPMGRIAKPFEFKGAAVYLCSDASSFATGMDLLVDGGHCAW